MDTAERARCIELKARCLKSDGRLTDRQISARLKKSMYWVKKTLGHLMPTQFLAGGGAYGKLHLVKLPQAPERK